jgi:hypothetical protein
MKRTLFVFALLTLLLTGFSSLQAQSAIANPSPATSGMTQFDAYKMNFTAAVNQGNTTWADPHRVKLVRFMEREITATEAVANAAGASKTAKTDVVRLKEILGTFQSMDLSTPAALAAAKTKLNLIDEFGQLTAKKTTATN